MIRKRGTPHAFPYRVEWLAVYSDGHADIVDIGASSLSVAQRMIDLLTRPRRWLPYVVTEARIVPPDPTDAEIDALADALGLS